MGIYSINSINEASVSSYLDDIQLEEVFEENYMEAALRHTYEIQENMNNVMKAIGIAELAEYEETGHEMIYVSESVGSIFTKIKDMLKKVWEKIASLFSKFMAKMQSFGKDDAAFVKKYRKDIITGSIDGLKVKGYKFSIDGTLKVGDLASKTTDGLSKDGILNIMTTIEPGINNNAVSINLQNGTVDFGGKDEAAQNEIMKKFSAIDNNDVIEKLRGRALGDDKTYTQKEFNTALFEKFRSGDSSKQVLEDKDINPGDMCDFLMGTKDSKKGIQDDYKKLYEVFKDDIKTIDNWNKSNSKYVRDEADAVTKNKNKTATILTKIGNLLVQSRTMCEQMEAAKMNAFNECRRQYKAICVKLIGRKSKNESVDYSSNDTGSFNSFLDNVKLI